MRNRLLFDEYWLRDRQTNSAPDSWCYDVMRAIDNEGGVYLSVLREWFVGHPFPSVGKKRHMRNLIESAANHDHRGAVNELCWYRFMCDLALNPQVLPECRFIKTPDFLCTTSSGIEFYCEVTTLNESDADAGAIHAAGSASLDQEAEIARILRKASEEKAEQLQYGHTKRKAVALVVFDYSTFSGLGTQRPVALANAILRTAAGLQTMKSYLSVLIYVERYVYKGRSRIRTEQSALFHNPLADYSLPDELFSSLWQFSLRSYSTSAPNPPDIVIT